MEACRMGDKELVGLFLEYGANVHFQNKDALTPLKVSKSDEVAEMLKSKGALQ
jgi:ankyrin repeat protein